MNSSSRNLCRGLTLIELSIAIMMGIATGAMLLQLFNQQLKFLQLYKQQNFLTEEAPLISVYVSRLIGKADGYRLYRNRADALSDTNPMTGNQTQFDAIPARVVVLSFRQPDNTTRTTMLSFENQAGRLGLYYFVLTSVNPTSQPPYADPGVAQWAVTRAASDIRYAMNLGVLQMILTGPNNERITYSGTRQQ